MVLECDAFEFHDSRVTNRRSRSEAKPSYSKYKDRRKWAALKAGRRLPVNDISQLNSDSDTRISSEQRGTSCGKAQGSAKAISSERLDPESLG
jgi:hypothetical protein